MPCWQWQMLALKRICTEKNMFLPSADCCKTYYQVMDSVRLAALRNRAARPSQGNAARACGPRSIHVQLFSAVSAPSPRQRQLHSLTALPPPPLAWPSGTHRHPASSAAAARCTDVTCSAMQGAQGGTPDPQQQFVQEQQQQEQRQPAGSSGSAAAGGWQGALQRSDSRILRACRWVTGCVHAAIVSEHKQERPSLTHCLKACRLSHRPGTSTSLPPFPAAMAGIAEQAPASSHPWAPT